MRFGTRRTRRHLVTRSSVVQRSAITALSLLMIVTGLASAPVTTRAQDSTPATAEGEQLFAANGVSAPILVRADLPDGAESGSTLLLERVEIPADATTPARTTTGPELIYVERGELTIEDDFGFGSTLPTGTDLSLNAGTTYTAANNGSSPLALLRLSIIGDQSETSSLASPVDDNATPIANPVDQAGTVTTLVSFPVGEVPETGATIFLAEAAFDAGADSGEQGHAGPIGVYVTDGTLSITSPSGLEGDIDAGRSVTLPAGTPLQARTDTGATALIIGIVDGSTGLMAEVTPEPTPTPEPTATTAPTPTVEPTATTAPTPTVEPTPTTEPTPEPTSTPEPTPTPEPSPTPEPTPTPLPAAGTVLYEADTSGGFEEWSNAGGWQTVSGMLVNDG